MSKRKSDTEISPSGSKLDPNIMKKHIALQTDYVKNCSLAFQGLMEHAMHEVRNIDISTIDFAESDLDFEGIAKAMKGSGPEEDARSVKESMALNTAEATITMSKVAELFIMDLAIKAWMAREIEPLRTDVPDNSIVRHELHSNHIRRAVSTHEEFDFLSESMHSYNCDTARFKKEVEDSTYKPLLKVTTAPSATPHKQNTLTFAIPPSQAPAKEAPNAKPAPTKAPATVGRGSNKK